MEKFKVGDRVALYHCGSRYVGSVAIVNDSLISVNVSVQDGIQCYRAHENQLRKLIKKEPKIYLVVKADLLMLEYVEKYCTATERARMAKVKVVK